MLERKKRKGEREGIVDIFIYFKKLAHVITKADIFETCRAAGILEAQKSINITAWVQSILEPEFPLPWDSIFFT